MKIAILGAQAPDRSQLAQALRQALPGDPANTEALVLSDSLLLQATAQPDPSSDASAIAQLRNHDLILLIGTDGATPWDAQVRAALQQQALHFTVLYGTGQARIDAALQTVRHALRLPTQETTPTTPWRWNCEKCSDPECEHRLFSALLADASVRP